MNSIYGEFYPYLEQVMNRLRREMEEYDRKVFAETGEHIYEHFIKVAFYTILLSMGKN